ncbi:hypothetical protein P9990_17700 [Prescottella equi]|uniref:hypothetical protein n=1 Tax=Rhodococcus hoagii TaxID=43767 RepID=UPI00257517B7|nr:hypothetical protein [Prescottella equi]WJJ10407.1 hypothetical protein P9990_17700 [Prescottella equi]
MSAPKTFRKKPVEIEAMRVASSFSDVAEWCGGKFLKGGISGNKVVAILINTLEGEMRADVGDWIIRGVAGEFYPCKPDIFERTYHAVSPDAAGAATVDLPEPNERGSWRIEGTDIEVRARDHQGKPAISILMQTMRGSTLQRSFDPTVAPDLAGALIAAHREAVAHAAGSGGQP